jgi:hypothetical protein
MSENSQEPQTFGQMAVGLSFNPSGDNAVHNCKAEFAAVIDRMNLLRSASDNAEVKRMASIAITEAQTAQMWAVKALTWRG